MKVTTRKGLLNNSRGRQINTEIPERGMNTLDNLIGVVLGQLSVITPDNCVFMGFVATLVQPSAKMGSVRSDSPRFPQRGPKSVRIFGRKTIHASVEVETLEPVLLEEVGDNRFVPIRALLRPFDRYHSASCPQSVLDDP